MPESDITTLVIDVAIGVQIQSHHFGSYEEAEL